MARKRIKVSRKMLLIWFAVTGIIFLIAPQSLTSKFQVAFASIFRWPLQVGRSITLSARSDQSPEQNFKHKENIYQIHIANLEAQLNQAHEKINLLSGIRNRHPLQGVKVVLAGLITTSQNASQSSFVINRGSNDFIQKSQFIIADNAIAGIITEVWARQARGRLITDPTFSIVVNIKGLSTPALMQGAGAGLAKIKMAREKVEVDEFVIAEQKPGYLDVPMVIGKVQNCQRNDENPLLWDITIVPACDLENLKDVAVLIPDSQN
jgi:cell shape-determining protein MreC